MSTSQPSTLGNQRGGVNSYHQKQFLALLPGTPLFKIGELHTIFYLCFLFLLVYLSVFALVSFIKNQKNSYLAFSFPFYLVKHVRMWCLEGIRSLRFPSEGWREYEESMGQNF